MTIQEQRQRGAKLFQEGRYEEAACEFKELLNVTESADIWNDWAAAQAAAGRLKEAKRGFKKALKIDPRNEEATNNLALLARQSTTKTSAPAQPGNMPGQGGDLEPGQAFHRQAVQCYREGKNEEAAHFISKALNVEKTSVRWNDFATIALAGNNVAGAEEGYRRALQLDAKNQLAATNLVLLLVSLHREREAEPFLGLVSPEMIAKQREAIVRYRDSQAAELEFLKFASTIPDQDPSLPAGQAEPLRQSRDSGFFVRQCYGKLREFSSDAMPAAMEALARLSSQDYRYSSVLALRHMDQSDFDAALRLFHQAFDQNPLDLSIKSLLVECERKQHRTNRS